MADQDTTLPVFGTTEPPLNTRLIQLGPLSFLFSQDAVRRISWNGVELVRGISWPIRDENWGTYPPEIATEEVSATADRFHASLTFAVAGGKLACALSIEGAGTGEITASLTMAPNGTAFPTNRAGFTVLHPIQGIAGSPLTVTHPDGTQEDNTFPRLISPSQPVMNIAGMRYGMHGAEVKITFDGEVFEMEDQRNWSDASFKTYCVPLVYPFVYHIDAPITQTIRMRLGGAGSAQTADAAADVTATLTEQKAPAIGLAVEPGWTGSTEARALTARTGASHLLLRIDSTTDHLPDAASLAKSLGAEMDAEIVLNSNDLPRAQLQEIARHLTENGLEPQRVMALPRGYLNSHQPSGPWPDGPTPGDLYGDVRAAFPNAAIGGGMMTNFTEMNRCRPDPAHCDYITHGNTALVHAGDDMSVLETLETLPQIFESAKAMAGGKPYRLGLVSIGMRSNPYGAAVAENPEQVRRTMGREDPRHRGLFGAAWAVGVLAATEGSAVEALCLAAPVGPFGLVYERQTYPQAGYDDGTALVYPLYHPFREACALAGLPRLGFAGLPGGLAAYGALQDGAARAMIANLTDHKQTLALAEPASVAILDTTTFQTAVRDPDWLETAKRQQGHSLTLPPFATAFMKWSVTRSA